MAQHVAGVDAHLVAEPASDVGADDADLVLGETRHQGVERPVGVGRLRRRPDRELSRDLVHIGDRPACLHRRRVDPRVQHVLGDHDLGLGEHGVGRCLVAGLPVEDVVVRLALDVVADHRRVGLERACGVDERRERLVLDLDELEGVARRVAVLGHDEGDFLALEPDLVGGENREHVMRERRDPSQPERLERLAGDDGLDLRMSLRSRCVDARRSGRAGSGLRRTAPCSMPGSCRSST